jgi:cysteine desulfurase
MSHLRLIMRKRHYLDWNATAPLREEARAAMAAAMDICGNPSSVHAEGRAARGLMERARAQVAGLVGADAATVVFTSGGTEANALALSPGWLRDEDAPLAVSAVEHPSVACGGGFLPEHIRILPVTADGVVDLDAARAMLREGPALVSVMLANNETGAIQPIRALADLVHAAGGLLHVDAIQGPGKTGCDMTELGADLLSLSGHKIGAPMGVGALVVRAGLHLARPPVRGGGQERGLRAGTENLVGIVGFGAAADACRAGSTAERAHMAGLQAKLEAGLKAVAPDTVVFAEKAPRLPNTTLFGHPGLRAQTAVIAFDLDGFAVSSGSACSSGKVQPSAVLAAMGVPAALAGGAIRLSTGFATDQSDIEGFLETWKKRVESLVKRQKTIAA